MLQLNWPRQLQDEVELERLRFGLTVGKGRPENCLSGRRTLKYWPGKRAGNRSIKSQLALLLILATFFASPPLYAKSVFKEVSEAVEKRDDAYATDFLRSLDEANEAVRVLEAALMSPPSPEEWGQLFTSTMEKIHQVSIARGRGRTLSEFREFFASRPSATQAELWMQERLSSLQSKSRELDILHSEFSRLPDDSPTLDVIRKTRAWTVAHGELTGEVGELGLIDANLRTYFLARGSEKARRKSLFSSLLGGIANGLRQQTELAPHIRSPTVVQCNEYFSGTICRAN